MKVNTDMWIILRGGYTCCVPGCYSNTKREKELSFHKFPRDVSMREKWVNSIKRKELVPGEQHQIMLSIFSWCQKARQTRRAYYISIASSVLQRKPPKIHLPLEPPAKRKKIGTGKSKALADAVGEEVDFVWTCRFQ